MNVMDYSNFATQGMEDQEYSVVRVVMSEVMLELEPGTCSSECILFIIIMVSQLF